MLIDEVMPKYQIRKDYQILIDAPKEDVFNSMLNSSEVMDSPILRTLIKIRELPAKYVGNNEKIFPKGPMSLNALFTESSFTILGREDNREVVFGIVGRFWDMLYTSITKLSGSDEFKAFNESGFGKVTMNFYLESLGEKTKLQTETRIFFPEDKYLKRFKVYWYIIAPFSGLIRKIFLKNIKASAEGNYLAHKKESC